MSEPRPEPTPPTKRQLAEAGPRRTTRVARVELAVIAALFVVVALMVGYAAGQYHAKQSAQHQAKTLYSQVVTAGASPSVTPPGAPPATAITGAAGRQGSPGANGNNGARGPRGRRGPSGKPGRSGKAGPPGSNGQNGDQGPTGSLGPPGPPGPSGAQGPQGPQGSTGPQGPKGDQGQSGDNGTDGEPPQSFTFTFLGVPYDCTRDQPFDPAAPTYTCQPQNGAP